MNSKWQANRIGLVDFWYYDIEEFYFSEGRMLLRGSNGSGKSVTMQSFIPLLLDGNIRPERLDPFGSRARRMENYLLEENDGREERTGYLYMEFKRLDTDAYITIGMGLRGRRNKKLEPWYFIVTDGRRVNKDFLLYKEMGSKIVLSKRELKNRIADGGQVFDSQNEYMEAVNHHIFKFETIDEYKEMIDLLIQLRTPKLSKDFKPSIINEILSSSLQMLSEEDLRPMSEAIENMDGLKTNVDALKISIEAADKINRVYERYNFAVLLEKAKAYCKSEKDYKGLSRQAAELESQLVREEKEQQEKQAQIEKLNREQIVLKEEQDSLDASDAKALKTKEIETTGNIERLSVEVQNKQSAYEAKKDTRREVEGRKKDTEIQLEMCLDEIKDMLSEMSALVEECSFDEHSFMENELLQHPGAEYGFQTHKTLLKQRMDIVAKSVQALKKQELIKEAFDEKLKELDQEKELRDKAEREYRQYENQLASVKSELAEKFYHWEQENRELKIPDAQKQEIAVQIDTYGAKSDYGDIRDAVRSVKSSIDENYQKERLAIQNEMTQKEEELQNKKTELEEWESKKEPEPEISESVRRNRECLREHNISYIQFYKAVDFADKLSEERRGYLEEALEQMGILDALIVSADDREKILQMDKGMCDKYIFSDAEKTKTSLAETIEVDNSENDILFYQQVSSALMSIGYQGGHHTRIGENGDYQLGVISGTITKSGKAKYIGVKAREAYKQQQIVLLKTELDELEKDHTIIRNRLRICEEKLRVLNAEFETFPGGEDLKLAYNQYAQAFQEMERKKAAVTAQEQKVKEAQEKLGEINKQVHECCALAYLPQILDVCEKVQEQFAEYKELLGQLEIGHNKYREQLRNIESLQEHLEEIDADLDNLLYDLQRLKKDLQTQENLLESIKGQLALTNYEQIKERLDYCADRLLKLPDEIIGCVKQESDIRNQILNLQERRQYNETEMGKARESSRYNEGGFKQEYQLDYVSIPGYSQTEPSMADCLAVAEKVINMADSRENMKERYALQGDLQGTYHEYRAELVEYRLSLEELFADVNAAGAEKDTAHSRPVLTRIDIVGRYAGVKVKFDELLEKLAEDLKEQEILLSMKDRELFEDILANTISKKIRAKIHSSQVWVGKMNELMNSMKTSSGLTLSLKWRNKSADQEDQLNTKELVELLRKDSEILREEEIEKLSRHFRSKIAEARKTQEENSDRSFYAIMREILDYRKWFEFQLECQKTGEVKKELTDRVFFTFSGGEKAMSMYVPLFSAVVAKYKSADADAPRLISLDEAFAGVDEMNIKDMFRLMVEFEFDFIINSQILYGDYETVPSIAIYQLIRPENAKFVTVIRYHWDGKIRTLMTDKSKEQG